MSGEGEDEEGTVWNSPLNKIKTTKINTRYIIENKKIYPQKHQGLTHTLFFCLFGKSLRSVSLPPSCLIATPSNFGQGRKKAWIWVSQEGKREGKLGWKDEEEEEAGINHWALLLLHLRRMS